MCRRGALTVALALLLFLILPAASSDRAASECGGETIATARVAGIIDGRTFTLDDGRAVRLAAIEVPAMPSSDDTAARPAARAAKAALAELVAGRTAELKRLGAETDRYGRLVAVAYLAQEGSAQAVQRDLFAAGHARMGSRIGERTCAAELLAAEQAARSAKLGLWADPYYGTKRTEAPAEILAERGHFAVIEGKMVPVRTSGGTIYVNFGRRWSRDFTVTISKRRERSFAAAGVAPNKLSGRRIRVRGFVEVRGGPRVYAARPEQIEILRPNSATKTGPK